MPVKFEKKSYGPNYKKFLAFDKKPSLIIPIW